MKSPWNFLTRLTSRRKQDEAEQGSIGRNGDQKAIESEAQKKPALLLRSPEVAPDVDSEVSAAADLRTTTNSVEINEVALASPAADIEAVHVSESDSIDESRADLTASVSADAIIKASPKVTPTKRPRRAKAERAQPVETQALARTEDQVAQSVPPANPFLDEVTKLDEDIRLLRSQLTQKLVLQNAHLKKMLERFDRS